MDTGVPMGELKAYVLLVYPEGSGAGLKPIGLKDCPGIALDDGLKPLGLSITL